MRHRLTRQPEGFSVFRLISSGRIVAFTTRLVLPAPPDETDTVADPVVAAAWQYYHVPSRVIDLSDSRVQAEAMRARGRAHGFLVHHDHAAWAERLRGVLADSGVRCEVGGREYGLFTVDWGYEP
ncbi:hypothetical protein [Streptomyces shenzhenensis]|uniref:hypothetical protein n=1 Tax=Streptomyces shenzhenensis TaxID=943815 RepID=UPI0015F004D0|nr:hypothetical protein [Streptomyces shenzhenensis]